MFSAFLLQLNSGFQWRYAGSNGGKGYFDLEDSPYVFGCMAELAASDTCTQIELADSDAIILDVIGKVVASLRHGSHKHSYALTLAQAANVIAYTDHLRVETQGDLATIWR